MADNFADILFKGGFDPSEIVRGIDAMVAALKRSQDQEAQLRKEIDTTSLSLKENDDKIQKVTLTIAGLEKGAKGYTSTNRDLNTELAGLNDAHAKYTATLASQNKQLGITQATNESLAASYDKATAAVTTMQLATGKTVAPSLNDGTVLNQLRVIKENFATIGPTVEKTVNTARGKLNDLVSTENNYKKSIAEINSVLKANAAESALLNKQLTVMQGSTTATSADVNNLRTQLKGVNANTAEFEAQLGKERLALEETTAQIKLQTVAVAESERGSNKLKNAIANVTSGSALAAREVNSVTRRVLNFANVFAFGAIVEGVQLVVAAVQEYIESEDKLAESQKLGAANLANLNEVEADAHKKAGEQINDLKILYAEATNANEPIKDRLDAVKALQTEFPDYFKNIQVETILNGGAKDSYDALTASILQNARAKAVKDKLDDLETQKLDKQFQIQKVANAITNESNRAKDVLIANQAPGAGTAGGAPILSTRQNQQEAARGRGKAAIDPLLKDIASLNNQEKFLLDQVGVAAVAKQVEATDKTKDKKEKKEPDDDFEKRRQDFQEQISKLAESEYQSELTIRKAYADKLNKALQDISKDKTITGDEDAKLRVLAGNLNTAELTKALDDLHKKVKEEQKKFNDEIDAINLQAGTARIALIQNDFDRQRATIVNETGVTADKYKEARDRKIEELQKEATKIDFPKGYVDSEIESINAAYDSLLDTLDKTKNEKLQALAFDTFQKLTEESSKRFTAIKDLGVSENSLIDVTKQTDLYLKGEISYKDYQKALTKIAEDESESRYDIERKRLQGLYNTYTQELQTGTNNGTLTDKQKEDLTDKIADVSKQQTNLDTAHEKGLAANTHSEFKEKLDEYVAYADAIGNLANSVISFWQEANAAEQRALDRSIAIQDRRVQQAQVIADHGNSTYLRLEQDRQNQLLVMQENAARRTIAINAALQASQLIVALVSALAKGAETGGALGAIIDVAAIGAAIAGAFAIAQSFKPVTPSFFVGTEDTGKGSSHVDNKGGFHAILHPHERVVPEKHNKKLAGISNENLVNAVQDAKAMQKHVIPAATFNFFKEHHKSKPQPSLNIPAMEMAINANNIHSIQLAAIMEETNRKMEENNALQKGILKSLKGIGVSVNVDRNGVAVSVLEAIHQKMINKKL